MPPRRRARSPLTPSPRRASPAAPALALALALAAAIAPAAASAQVVSPGGLDANLPPSAQGLVPPVTSLPDVSTSGTATTPAARTVPPRLHTFVPAEYPAAAQSAGHQATVLLQLGIDTDGHVTEATVLEPAGEGFDEAAQTAARRFVFDPARQGDRAVAARIRYRYRFTLQTAAPAAPQGDSAVLEGVVRDNAGHPLAGARVTFALGTPAPAPVLTDAQGRFRLELDRVGTGAVTVEADGFRPYRADETLADRDDVRVVYRLALAAVTATRRRRTADDDEPGVIVRSQRPAREVTRTTLDRREITRIPGTGGDALRAIQNLPGLARAPFFSGALIVRGSAPADTQVFADGTEIPLLYHFGGLASVIQTEMLDRIDFYPGNFSARYGRATGGIVDVGLRSPNQRRFRGVANVSLIDASLFVEGPITSTLSFAVAARRSYIDAVLGVALSTNPSVSVTAAPVYWDYQAVLEWRPSRAHRLRLAVFGDDDTLSILFSRPNSAAPTFAGQISTATRFHIAQLRWENEIAPGFSQRAMISAGFTQLTFAAALAAGNFDFKLSNVPINARYEFTAQVHPAARLNVGFDISAGPATVSLNIPSINTGTAMSVPIATDINTVSYRPAAYIEGEITPVRGLRLIPGIRVDWYRDIQQAIVQPRFAGRYEFVTNWTIKGGIGLYGQPPSFQQSTNAPNTAAPGRLLGNPNLLPIRAMHYALGMEHNFSSWVSLSVEGFYKDQTNLVRSTSVLDQLANSSLPPYNNGQIGRVYGAELLLRHRSGEGSRFFGWVAYTLMRAERRDLPSGDWRLYGSDQTHILTLVGNVRLGRGWEVGARFRYVTGSPTTPVAGSYFNADSGSYVAINGATNSVRNPDFHQLDLRVDKGWTFRWGQFGIFLEVLNVYNHANAEGVVSQYNYLQSGPLTGIPFFPNLGLRGEI